MGNCISSKRVIRIMKGDGKILEYSPPLTVLDVLANFDAHAIYDEVPVCWSLAPETVLQCGHLYYLLPEVQPSTSDKEAPEKSRRSVRIKVIVTKKELREMLEQESFSACKMIDRLQKKPCIRYVAKEGGDVHGHGGWTPVLQSIPEGGTLC